MIHISLGVWGLKIVLSQNFFSYFYITILFHINLFTKQLVYKTDKFESKSSFYTYWCTAKLMTVCQLKFPDK
jgi:hypothetical protein